MSLPTIRNKIARMAETIVSVREEMDELLSDMGFSVDSPGPGQVVTKHKGRKPGSKNKPKAAPVASGEPQVVPGAGLTPTVPVETAAS